MLELGKKEDHLLRGIWIQLLLVAIMVFVFTQATRQLTHQKEQFARLQEQMTMAREEVAQHPKDLQLDPLKAQVNRLQQRFFSEDQLNGWMEKLGVMAYEIFSIEQVNVEHSARPAKMLVEETEDKDPFKVDMYAIQMKGFSTSKNVQRFLRYLTTVEGPLGYPLTAIKLKAHREPNLPPVQLELKWWIPVVLADEEQPLPPKPSLRPVQEIPLEWGARVEPFVSVFEDLDAHDFEQTIPESLMLKQIQWEPTPPQCLLGSTWLRQGEWLEGYQVVLIMRDKVLLQGPDEEIWLFLEETAKE